ncbi:hypothetical protein PR202_ga19752 [Eleusine coracana subsp. coracana]|uniref:Uncharacterized protein n=1 Tax=Eleusine coracana subsp. coracana TaxID=191504 RepID=A0AAV5CWC6_ELECO|nr:hypothetical protein PR202_ga19752 [Eleusine coracana subsp. coracana]
MMFVTDFTFSFLAKKVNEGLVSSGMMGSYIVFLCWSALHSEPQTGKCHSQMKIVKDGAWATIVSFIIAICSIVMATFSTGIDTKSFQVSSKSQHFVHDVHHFSSTTHEIFFRAGAALSQSILHSIIRWSIDVGWASTWVKIINEWFAASIYSKSLILLPDLELFWRLISPVVWRNQRVNDEEIVAHRPTALRSNGFHARVASAAMVGSLPSVDGIDEIVTNIRRLTPIISEEKTLLMFREQQPHWIGSCSAVTPHVGDVGVIHSNDPRGEAESANSSYNASSADDFNPRSEVSPVQKQSHMPREDFELSVAEDLTKHLLFLLAFLPTHRNMPPDHIKLPGQ